MPEGYYRPAIYPSKAEFWLEMAAKDGLLVTCQCKRCRRVVRYLASDLLPLLGPDHRVMTVPPYPCRCGERDRISIKVNKPVPGDWGGIEVRRPSGIRRTQLWRTVMLGEEVENKGFGARDRPAKSELERGLERSALNQNRDD